MIFFKSDAKTTAEQGKASPKKDRLCFPKQEKIIPFRLFQKGFILNFPEPSNYNLTRDYL